MCRSIKTLRRPDGPATNDEIREASLQFVRKISGYRAPSQANKRVFDTAVRDIETASKKLLASLKTRQRVIPKDRVADPDGLPGRLLNERTQ